MSHLASAVARPRAQFALLAAAISLALALAPAAQAGSYVVGFGDDAGGSVASWPSVSQGLNTASYYGDSGLNSYSTDRNSILTGSAPWLAIAAHRITAPDPSIRITRIEMERLVLSLRRRRLERRPLRRPKQLHLRRRGRQLGVGARPRRLRQRQRQQQLRPGRRWLR